RRRHAGGLHRRSSVWVGIAASARPLTPRGPPIIQRKHNALVPSSRCLFPRTIPGLARALRRAPRAAERVSGRGGLSPSEDPDHVGRSPARRVPERAGARRDAGDQSDAGSRGDPEARAGRAGDALPEPGGNCHQAVDDRRPRDLAATRDPGARRLPARGAPDRPRRPGAHRAGLRRPRGARDGTRGVRGLPPRGHGPARPHRRRDRKCDPSAGARDAERPDRAGPGRHVADPLPACGRRASGDHRGAAGSRCRAGAGGDAAAPRERAAEPRPAEMMSTPGSGPLRFGAGLLGHYSRAYSVSRVAELGALCERLGFDSYWVADQRWMRDVWVSLTATATRTSRILLGTRVTDPYVRHPALTAVAVASLDELSGGRAILGLGAGGSGFREMGIERKKPVTALREAIELIRRLLAGEEVDYPGELVRFHRGALEFTARREIPVVIVARGPKILELGGRVADGVMVASMASPPAVKWGIEHVRAGMRKAGRSAAAVELSSMVYTSISDDGPAARWIVRRGIPPALRGSFPT